MIRTVTDYLEETVKKYADKMAFSDEMKELTFVELRKEAHQIAMSLINMKIRKQPIAIYMDKSVTCVSVYMGIAYSGNFYSPIDTKMPSERIEKIIEKLQPAVVITDLEHRDEAEKFAGSASVCCFEEMQEIETDEEVILRTARSVIDTDVLYILFTSGSTGIPKGVIISHKGLVDFTEWAAEEFGFNDKNIIANQTPLYFSMSIFDIYQTLRNGSTTYFVPHKLFSLPAKLMKYLEEKKVDTIDWVPSALSYVSILKALNKPHVSTLKNVLFGGEVMPVKQLNKWIEEYPTVRFINIYGPTEVTDTCTYYEVNRAFEDNEMLPIGAVCRNKDVFILDDNNKLISGNDVDTIGEICVRASGIAYGYYNDIEKTEEVFVQNPLNNSYREIIYRTGDLGRYNSFGEMVYVSRKDSQIKHKGHRIELSEIEAACSAIEEIDANCCLYDAEKASIVLFYVGNIEGKDIAEKLKNMIPEYMIPGKRIKLDKMPQNLNGKIDRQELKAYMQEGGAI